MLRKHHDTPFVLGGSLNHGILIKRIHGSLEEEERTCTALQEDRLRCSGDVLQRYADGSAHILEGNALEVCRRGGFTNCTEEECTRGEIPLVIGVLEGSSIQFDAGGGSDSI